MANTTLRTDRVEQFFDQHHAALAHQGAVVVSWRKRASRRVGPYYRLECRLPRGPKVSVYLGLAGPLVAAARSRLAELQRPLRQRRQMSKVIRHLRRGARAARANLAAELSKIGLYLKGSEIRGTLRRGLPHWVVAYLADPPAATTENLEN